MKKILINGYLGFNNFGDEALLRVLINDLEELGVGKENITVASNDINHTASNHGVSAVDRWSLLGMLNAITSSDCVVFIGGIFQDKTSQKSLIYYSLILFIANLLKKKTVLYGVGIGPIEQELSSKVMSYAFNGVELLSVRDDASANLAPFNENLITTIDPAWTMKVSDDFYKRVNEIDWNKPILGVSLMLIKELSQKHIQFMAERISRTMNEMKEWQVVFIPCMGQEDLPALYPIYDMVAKKIGESRAIMLDGFNELPIEDQAGVLSSCDVMFGMRYHSLILPLSNGKPVLGITHNQKIKSLMDFSSQCSFSLTEDLEQSWSYFWQTIKHTSEKAESIKEEARKLHDNNKQLLKLMLR